MLMHAENSSLQDSSAQRRTNPVLPGIGVPPTASQTTALPHQCRQYLAKTYQDCHHTLPRPPNFPAKAAQLTCQGRPTYLPHTYPSALHVLIHQPLTRHARAVTLSPCLGRTSERLIRDPRTEGRVCRGRVREIDQWLEGH